MRNVCKIIPSVTKQQGAFVKIIIEAKKFCKKTLLSMYNKTKRFLRRQKPTTTKNKGDEKWQ
jgi:hypothetical protein